MATPKNIIAQCATDIRREALANAALSPGHLIELISTGKVQVHATANGPALMMIAVENSLQGEEVGDAYAAGDLVSYWVLRAGDRFWGKVLNGQNIAIGDKCVSAGDGTFREYVEAASATALEQACLCIAVSACDMSGSSGVDPDGWCLFEVV